MDLDNVLLTPTPSEAPLNFMIYLHKQFSPEDPTSQSNNLYFVLNNYCKLTQASTSLFTIDATTEETGQPCTFKS